LPAYLLWTTLLGCWFLLVVASAPVPTGAFRLPGLTAQPPYGVPARISARDERSRPCGRGRRGAHARPREEMRAGSTSSMNRWSNLARAFSVSSRLSYLLCNACAPMRLRCDTSAGVAKWHGLASCHRYWRWGAAPQALTGLDRLHAKAITAVRRTAVRLEIFAVEDEPVLTRHTRPSADPALRPSSR
jgi:hypothetical protein